MFYMITYKKYCTAEISKVGAFMVRGKTASLSGSVYIAPATIVPVQ
jgi:hypothetical protein